MKTEMLSVVIPVYNLENYIEECINSIKRQSYDNLEIIIVDDGSDDRTKEICQRMAFEDSRIVLISQEKSGVTAARLKGGRAAHGKYITFVDGDDYIHCKMYENMIPLMERYDMVSCGISQQITNDEVKLVIGDFEGAYDTHDRMEALWGKMLYDFEQGKLHPLSPSVVNKIFKRELLLPIMSQVDEGISYGEDAVMVLLYTLKCQTVMFLKDAFYFYRFRESSATHTLNKKMLESSVQIYNVLKREFDVHHMAESLNKQLEKWMLYLLIHSVNKYMGFSKENRIPQFWVGLDEFVGKKLVIYGAGQMGQDIVWSYNQMGHGIYAWIDRDYLRYRDEGMDVQGVETLQDEKIRKEMQVLLIAVSSQSTAIKIRDDLLQLGIPDNMIIWKRPVKVY